MQQQATARQPDETICLRCGTTLKRDAGQCPNCGSPIAPGPQHTAAAPIQPARNPIETADVVGVGRYVLNFVLAGLVGLAITYFLRREGWLATWISAAVFLLIVVLVVSTR